MKTPILKALRKISWYQPMIPLLLDTAKKFLVRTIDLEAVNPDILEVLSHFDNVQVKNISHFGLIKVES